MAAKRKVARKKVSRKSARVAGPEAQLTLLKEMFATFLLLHGVAQRSVAAIVAMDKTRVSELSQQVNQKARSAK